MLVGIAIIVIGIVFLLQNMGLISVSVWQVIWPLLIILLGVSMITKGSGCCGWGRWQKSEK